MEIGQTVQHYKCCPDGFPVPLPDRKHHCEGNSNIETANPLSCKMQSGDTPRDGMTTEEEEKTIIEDASSFVVEGEEFDDGTVEFLAEKVLPSAKALRNVTLSKTKFSPVGLDRLLRAVLHCPSVAIESISIRDFFIHADAAATLAHIVSKHRASLLRLDVTRCHLDDITAQPLADSISKCECLHELRLVDNDIVAAFALPIEKEVPLFPGSLRVLDLSGNRMEQAHFRGLCNALRPCGSVLEELYLARCCVTAEGLQSLLKSGLYASQSLRVLNLSKGRLLESSGPLLCSILTECPRLERLYAHDNFVGPDGAARVAIGFSCAKNLTVLGMGKCHLGGRGARWIAEAIKNCSSLRELDLSENNIQDEDMLKISSDCSDLTLQMKLIDLSYNPLTEDCYSALRFLMELKGGHLCHILVRGTGLEAKSAYLRPTDER